MLNPPLFHISALIAAVAVTAGCGDNWPECSGINLADVVPLPPPCAGQDCRAVFVVAHPDDDLLFMNPDVLGSLRAGWPTMVIYVTAGELSGPPTASYWMRREHGIVNAYMAMLDGNHASHEGRDETCAKLQAFSRYAVFDSAIWPDTSGPLDLPETQLHGDYGLRTESSWQRRQYRTVTDRNAAAVLRNGDQCIGVWENMPVAVDCSNAARWRVERGRLQLAEQALCLAVTPEQPPRGLVMKPCAELTGDEGAVAVFENGQVRTVHGECLARHGEALMTEHCSAGRSPSGHVSDVPTSEQTWSRR